jgi:predicted phage terminase large subunit-like protein|tara:strand:- start:10508 stop:11908 length:1401 start_codon:yes stop_codon:yes gene_type:complete
MARASLIKFTEYTFPQYQSAVHHRLIAEKLEAVERGKIDRLMIFMPPRHGKSELASKRFPAWALGKNPKRQIIAASYNSELASDFGRNVRNIIRERKFSNVFAEVELAPDSQAANRWNTNKGGTYVAAGVGTAVTGRGADILLIDDPMKDREEAESETIRDKVWNWYTSTAYTRLMPGGAVILIQTRWHEDDLAGRLLEAETHGGDKWDKLILPAINDNGDALWPERYPLPALERIRNAISMTGVRDWESLYQQNPTPAEGSFFKRDWYTRRHDEAPKVHIYITSDYAVTEDGGDWTEHGVWGFNGEDLFQLDWWSGQTSADVWIDALLDLVTKWKPLCVFGEGGVIEKSVRPMLKRRMIERKVHCRMEWIASVRDKATRARAFQARSAMGTVSLKRGEQGDDVLTQLLSFPAGKHDDKVDVCSLMGMVIDEAHPAIVLPKKPKTKRDAWDYDSASNDGSSDWKVA